MASTRILLSGSTNGKPIKVTGTATGASVTVHTAVTGVEQIDTVYLWASNTSASAATITIEWGGTTDPDNLLVKGYSIAANSGLTLLASGIPLNNALVIKAFAGTANVLNLHGYVVRMTR